MVSSLLRRWKASPAGSRPATPSSGPWPAVPAPVPWGATHDVRWYWFSITSAIWVSHITYTGWYCWYLKHLCKYVSSSINSISIDTLVHATTYMYINVSAHIMCLWIIYEHNMSLFICKGSNELHFLTILRVGQWAADDHVVWDGVWGQPHDGYIQTAADLIPMAHGWWASSQILKKQLCRALP